MPRPEPLPDPKHEEACQLVVTGRKSQRQAYAIAFGVPEDSEANNSSRWFQQEHIRSHIRALRRWRSVMTDLDEGWVMMQLKAIAKNAVAIGNANLDDYFEKDANGRRIGIDLAEVSRARMAVLDEVTVEEFVEGRGEDAQRIRKTRIKIKSAQSAIAATELIGKQIGMWPAKVAVSDPDGGALGSGILGPIINLIGKPDGK